MMGVYDQIKEIQVSQTFHDLIQMSAALVLGGRKKSDYLTLTMYGIICSYCTVVCMVIVKQDM